MAIGTIRIEIWKNIGIYKHAGKVRKVPFLSFLLSSGGFLLFCIKSNQLLSVGKNLNAILTFFSATQAIKKCISKLNFLFCFEVWINLLRKCKNLSTQVIITWVWKNKGDWKASLRKLIWPDQKLRNHIKMHHNGV